MTTDKSQPTGWVVVDFDDGMATFRDSRTWQPWCGPVIPFASRSDADGYKEGFPLRKLCEVHPWPLPSSVLARLKARHPTVDWSQVPVADAPVEKPGRWVLKAGCSIDPYRDRDGWKQSANVCSSPWSTRAEVEEFMKSKGWNPSSVRPVNLDDLPAPAVSEPSEIEKLRVENAKLSARVGWLDMLDTEEGRRTFANEALRVDVEELRAEVEHLTRERDNARASLESVAKQLRKEADEAIRERDEARAELAKAHDAAEDDVESLREQLGKARISRLDEFAKAALTGTLAQDTDGRLNTKETAEEAVRLAQATIRALDGAGGA